MKVAIIGLAQDCRDGIPWNDPEWEVWGMPWDAEYWCRFHRAFEVHDDWHVGRPADYGQRLKDCSAYMLTPIDGTKQFPQAAIDLAGGYLSSSIGYMLALAIAEGATEIGLWGVLMEAADEYGYQRPNCEYLIGFARGRGIKVSIAQPSPLCKFSFPTSPYRTRYGVIDGPSD